ncbi:peptidase inhibitor family I36 protein [Actinoplanes sp. NPDC049596]|uniref:peptidase inhibitor family I36 protein n=1 Tax=unclassified Actinoplanes TaxID=2626549 RepID=UPI00343DDC1D
MKIRAAVVSALAVLGSTVALASPAQAAYTCGANEVCLYQDWGLHGSVKVFRDLTPGNGITDFRFYYYTNSANLNDSISSIYNRSAHPVWVFEDGNYNSQHPERVAMKINAGQALDFNIHTKMPNDTVSSIGMDK